MKRWWLPALVVAVLTLAFAVALQRRLSHFEEPPPRRVRLLTISATIDGSDRFIFTTNLVRIEHLKFDPPSDIIFDGEPWADTKNPAPRWAEIAAALDLPRAVVVQRRGRDVIALEHTETGFDLFFSDTLGGGAPYVVTIAIPQK